MSVAWSHYDLGIGVDVSGLLRRGDFERAEGNNWDNMRIKGGILSPFYFWILF